MFQPASQEARTVIQSRPSRPQPEATSQTRRSIHPKSMFELSAADLPEDILCEILLHNATAAHVDLEDRAFTTRSSSQVCRSWRQAALGCTKLWACVIDYGDDGLDWMQALLERSFPSPLRIPCGGSRPLSWTTLNEYDERTRLREALLLHHKDRWRHLAVCALPNNDRNDLHLIPDYLLQPAPNIEILELTSFNWKSEYHLGGTLFADQAPSLRRLELNDVHININALRQIGGQLEELSLSWDEYFDGGKQVATNWIEFLRFTPRLRYLFLQNKTSTIGDRISLKQSGLVTLDELRVLCLEVHSPMTCKAVVDVLAIPPKCGFIMFCDYFYLAREETIPVDMIQQRLGVCNREPHSSPKQALYAHIAPSKSYTTFSNFDFTQLSTFKETVEGIMNGEIKLADPPIAYRIGMSDIRLWRDQFRFFISVFPAFKSSFPTIAHLSLRIRRWLPTWRDNDLELEFLSILGNLTNVETLEITDTAYDTLFSIFERTGSHATLFPYLKSIHFFSNSLIDTDGINRIREFLQWRIDQNHPISTVFFPANSLHREVGRSANYGGLSEIVRVLAE